jgi:hypothetical protein
MILYLASPSPHVAQSVAVIPFLSGIGRAAAIEYRFACAAGTFRTRAS